LSRLPKLTVLMGLAVVVGVPTAAAVDLTKANLRDLVLKDPKVSKAVKDIVRHPSAASGALSRRLGDLTGDGKADLVVLVNSGGTANDIAYYVYAEIGGKVRDIRAVNDSYKVGVSITKKHRLVQKDPVYAADDPNCCPSAIRIRVFEWDGTRLVRLSDRTVPTGAA
jgi:hypothetical protein